MDVRRFGAAVPLAVVHARSASRRSTRPTTTSATPARSGRRAGRCGSRRAYAWHARARRGVRREVRLGAGQLVRVQRRRAATSRCARAAGPASTGRRRSAPSTAPPRDGVALFDESSFAKLEVAGPGRGRRCSSGCATTASRATSGRSPTRRCSTPAAGSSATSPSRGSPRSASRSSPARRSASTTARGSAATRRATASVAGPRRHRGLGVLRALGPARARHPAPLTPADLANADFPYMTLREITVGDVPVRALRVTFVGELGWELYCPAEYGAGAVAGAVGGGRAARARRRRLPGDRLAAAGEGLPRLGRRHHAGRDARTRPGLGFCVKLDKPGGFIGREALRRGAGGRAAQRLRACIVLDDPRSVALGNEPVRIGGEIVGRVTSGGYGYTVERSIAYAYLPPERAMPGTAVEVDIFGELGRRARSRASRCSTRAASGYAAPREPPDALPYDEAYDESGQPRPHYAELLAALGDPGAAARRGRSAALARGVSFGGRGRRCVRSRPRAAHPHRAGVVRAPGRDRAAPARARGVRGGRLRRGPRVEAGVLTREDVEASPHYEPAMRAPRRRAGSPSRALTWCAARTGASA